jgi:hypothetical protein
MAKRTGHGSSVADNLSLSRRRFLRGGAAAGAAAVGFIGSMPAARAEIWEEGDVQCHVPADETTPTYDIDDALLARFIRLSEVLAGASLRDKQLASQYLERYARSKELSPRLIPLIEEHERLSNLGTQPPVADTALAIMQNEALRPAAAQLIYLWYVSAFYLPLDGTPKFWIYGTPEQYERALLWSVVHAHAPMMPGGAPGYWAKKPVV